MANLLFLHTHEGSFAERPCFQTTCDRVPFPGGLAGSAEATTWVKYLSFNLEFPFCFHFHCTSLYNSFKITLFGMCLCANISGILALKTLHAALQSGEGG